MARAPSPTAGPASAWPRFVTSFGACGAPTCAGAVLEMRILHLAPLWYPVATDSFGGIETYLPTLIDALAELGCEQTLLASGDSRTSAELIAVRERSIGELMQSGEAWEIGPYEHQQLTMAVALAGAFDVVHSHLGWGGFVLSGLQSVRDGTW